MREIRPRLTDEWFAIIEQVRELGVDQALQRLRSYDDGKLIIDSKDDSVELKTNRVINLQDLLEKANVNEEEWLVERHVLNKWEVGAKDAEGNIIIEPLYQVKAWLKRKGFAEPDTSWTQKWIDRLVKHTSSKLPKPTSGVTSGVTNVVIADLHMGRFSECRLNYEYNTEIARDRLRQISSEIPNTHEINVFCLGDVIESFTGKNKENTWKELQLHGAKVALFAYDVLEEFFGSIPNLNKVYFVGGNHDRITDSKKDDSEAQVLEIIHGIFTRMGRFKTVFDPTLVQFEVDGISYILTHGDEKITKLPGSELVLEHGDPYLFNCILSGHLHKKDLIEEGSRFTKRIVPPIVSGSSYEFKNGWHSNPGYLLIQEHHGKTRITECPLR
jgi:predicted phosphodiesterase